MPNPTDAEVRELAREILSRPEYAGAAEVQQAPEPVVGFLEWLRQLLERLDALHYTDPLLFWLLYAGLLMLALLLVGHIVWSISRALRAPAGETEGALAPRGPSYVERAEVLAGQGNYLEAAHLMLLAFLERSARARVIRLRPEHTNRDVRDALEHSELPVALRGEVGQLISRTERSWFRDRDNDPELYARWHEAYAKLLRATA